MLTIFLTRRAAVAELIIRDRKFKISERAIKRLKTRHIHPKEDSSPDVLKMRELAAEPVEPFAMKSRSFFSKLFRFRA